MGRLLEEEALCDTCLALGTSLCDTPSTADRVPAAAARRAGLAIVSLQRTRCDGDAAVRIFARLDDTLMRLASALGIKGRLSAHLEPSFLKGLAFYAD